MLEPRSLRWAQVDLAEMGWVHLILLEQALHLMDHVAGETLLVSLDDGWKVVLPERVKSGPV